MRRFVLVCLGVLAVLPATAGGVAPQAPTDGTVSVHDADGEVRLRPFAGIVLGRVSVGELRVIAPDSGCDELRVWNHDDERERPLRGSEEGVVCVFIARDRTTAMRFRLLRGDSELTVTDARGLSLLAMGHGRVYLEGTPRRNDWDGTFSIDGQRPQTLPDRGRTFTVGARASLP